MTTRLVAPCLGGFPLEPKDRFLSKLSFVKARLRDVAGRSTSAI